MNDRDKLDERLFHEIGRCSDKIEKVSEIAHTHSGILKVQNIILAGLVVAIITLAFSIITDWTKTKTPPDKEPVAVIHPVKRVTNKGVVP